MAINAGFHKVYFDNIYNHLSGHSHASFISALQTRDAREMYTQKMLSDTMMQIGCVVMSHFVFSYIKLFPNAEIVLKEDEKSYSIADKWCVGAENMNVIYGNR